MQVNGVDLSKVDKTHLARVAAQLGAKAPPGATAQRLVEEVGKIFERTQSSLAGPCDNCGGMSDSALSECPFCGVGEDDVEAEGNDSDVPTPSSEVHMAELVAPADAQAIVGQSQASAVAERKLNEAMGRIEALRAMTTVSIWKIGHEIKSIYDAQLWLQRTKDGKPAYKSFDAFVHGELNGLSKTTAYWMMDISEAFSEAEVLAYGRTKLGLILKAPKEDRKLLLEKVAGGMNKRELTDEVNKARAAKGEFVRETSRSTDTKGRGTKASKEAYSKKLAKDGPSKKRGDTITVAKILGRQQVKLWCKPEKRGQTPDKRARKLTDKPIGLLDLENGVQMQFGITTSSAGDWILVVVTERP